MKKLITLIILLIVVLLVITGCDTITNDIKRPPALPNEEVSEPIENVDSNELQPPSLPEE